jgi:Pentapeptide repeats (9 copies)
LTRAKALEASYRAPADKALETKAQAAVASFDMYRGVTERIVSNAAYNEIRTRLSPGRQLTAGLIVALGVATFAVLVAWPDSPDPAADFHGAVLTGVNLNGTRLEGASFRGMTLTGIGLEQANLDEADFASTKLKDLRLVGAKTAGANFNGATFVNVVCPDGTNSDVAGGTCVAHEGPPAKSGP